MNLLVATIPRTGSTLLFNICRLLFEQAYGKNNVYSAWFQSHELHLEKENNIIKIHAIPSHMQKWSNKIITSVRDIRCVIASYAEFNKKFNSNAPEQMKKICDDYLSIYNSVKSKAHYTMKYEEYFENKEKIISEIIETLEINHKKIKIDRLLHDLDIIKNKKYDSVDIAETQMHPNHISKKTNLPIQERLSPEQIRYIESRCVRYLYENGYKIINYIKMM